MASSVSGLTVKHCRALAISQASGFPVPGSSASRPHGLVIQDPLVLLWVQSQEAGSAVEGLSVIPGDGSRIPLLESPHSLSLSLSSLDSCVCVCERVHVYACVCVFVCVPSYLPERRRAVQVGEEASVDRPEAQPSGTETGLLSPSLPPQQGGAPRLVPGLLLGLFLRSVGEEGRRGPWEKGSQSRSERQRHQNIS